MEGEVLEEDVLLERLRDSRRRFQRQMQKLIEKYNQPFEDTPLVQMSTLTYETPQGLRIWGGRLVKKRLRGRIQDSPVKPVTRAGGSTHATAQGHEPPPRHTQVPGAQSSRDIGVAIYQEDPVAGVLAPAVPQSPLENELRRKYLTQVDVLLQDRPCPQHEEDGEDTCLSLDPLLASPATPAPEYCCIVSGNNGFDLPTKPASPPREWDPPHPCSTDMAMLPTDDSFSLQGTSTSSFFSSQCCEAEDICNVTISDLYEGMLHSMSRLLSLKPAGIISTKTSIRTWKPRRRLRCKSRMDRTYCKDSRRPHRSSRETLLHWKRTESGAEMGASGDRKNLQGVSCHMILAKALPEAHKPQTPKLDSSGRELQVMPRKYSSSAYLGSNTIMQNLDWENGLQSLKWLISPVKIVSRPGILQSHPESRYREIRLRFDKLHQEYCLSPKKRPHPAGLDSWALDLYKGGPAGPTGPRSSKTCRLSLPFSNAKAERLNETCENLGTQPLEVGRWLPGGVSSSSLSKTDSTQSPGCSQQTADVFQGDSSGIIRKSGSPRAIPAPGIEPLVCGRNRYDEIKEKFDKLHQKYCQKSPQRTKAPVCSPVSPSEASAEGRRQTEASSGRVAPGSRSQGLQKAPLSPQWLLKSPERPTAVGVHVLPHTAYATRRDHPSLAKRCRLSDPQVCGLQVGARHSSDGMSRTSHRPGSEASPAGPGPEEQERKEEYIFQD